MVFSIDTLNVEIWTNVNHRRRLLYQPSDRHKVDAYNLIFESLFGNNKTFVQYLHRRSVKIGTVDANRNHMDGHTFVSRNQSVIFISSSNIVFIACHTNGLDSLFTGWRRRTNLIQRYNATDFLGKLLKFLYYWRSF